VGRGKLKERWDFYEEVNVFWGLGGELGFDLKRGDWDLGIGQGRKVFELLLRAGREVIIHRREEKGKYIHIVVFLYCVGRVLSIFMPPQFFFVFGVFSVLFFEFYCQKWHMNQEYDLSCNANPGEKTNQDLDKYIWKKLNISL